MAVSYNKLFKVLEKKDISLTKLRECIDVSTGTISKLGKNEYISLQTLEKISKYLKLEIGDLVEFKHEYEKSPLLLRLLEEKEHKVKGGIYHETQIILTYNSNHIEGSTLSLDETRYIFETSQVLIDDKDKVLNVDDLIETSNHFKAIDYMLEIVYEPLSEEIIKDLHLLLKRNTKDESLEWFNVGEYKKRANYVGGVATTNPLNVETEMKDLIKNYENNQIKTFEEIVEFHYGFERIHPFQDGNGRVGRLLSFKELLRNNHVPFTVDDDLKLYYYRGFKMYEEQKGYLIDTLLAGQDKYKKILDYFEIEY